MTWPLRPLSDVAEVRLGRQRSPKDHLGPQMRPYLRAANVTWAGLDLSDVKEMNFTDEEMATYRLEPGDLLLSEASGSPGEVGKPAIWSGEVANCAFQNTLIRVRSRLHDPRFLLLFFRSQALTGKFVPEARGVGIHHIGRARLAGWPTPVPELAEQRRIVGILEDHLSRLDAAGASIASAHKLKALRISRLKKERDALLEEGSPLAPLGKVCETSLGKMLDAKRNEGTPTPYLRNMNVRWGGFDLTSLYDVPLSGSEQERLALNPGDLMICEGGEPGRCAVWPGMPDNVTYQKALHRARLRNPSNGDPHFVALMLEEAVQSGRARRFFTGTTIKHLPQERLRMIEIPVPTQSRQHQSVRGLEALQSQGQRLQSATHTAIRRKEVLVKALLAEAFSGRLTGRASDLERAEEAVVGQS